MMYLHKNSVGSRRSEAVKQKVQGMRVSTGTEGYRQNGMKVRFAFKLATLWYSLTYLE